MVVHSTDCQVCCNLPEETEELLVTSQTQLACYKYMIDVL